MRAKSAGEVDVGRSFFNSASSSEKSLMRRGEVFLQVGKRVTVTRGGGVLRNPKNGGDIAKRQFVPNFQDEHLALFGRQPIDCGREAQFGVAAALKFGFGIGISFTCRVDLPARAPRIAAEQIECNRTDGGEEEGAVLDGMLLPPEANKCILDDVFGIGDRVNPLPREQDEARSELGKTDFPIFMRGDILHDLFRVFTFETPPEIEFV